MPKLTRQQTDERNRFVLETWKQMWPRTRGVGPESYVPAAEVNRLLREKFGENMRSFMMYALRDQAIAELKAEGLDVPEPARKKKAGEGDEPRPAPVPRERKVFEAGRSPVVGWSQPEVRAQQQVTGLPHMVRDVTGDGADLLDRVFAELRNAGVANLAVEARGAGYVVINSAA